jgi:hypothetical protein
MDRGRRYVQDVDNCFAGAKLLGKERSGCVEAWPALAAQGASAGLDQEARLPS